MKIWNVNVAFNVKATTQEEAADKMRAYLDTHLTGQYEAIEEPELQPHIAADECETLIT
jgi:hypothetical protein